MPGNPYKPERDLEYEMNPYESFMRNHLRHYGYYTGRNEGYRTSVSVFEDWERTHDYNVSDNESETEYENQALKDKFDPEGRLQDEFNKTTQLVFSCEAGKMVPRLREPRNLYALTKEQGAQHAARWPSAMEVLPERVVHIPYIPSEAEAFYQPTGVEKMPMTGSDSEGRVVFYNPAPKEGYFLRSRVGGNRNGCSDRAVKLSSPEDKTLIFESRFESGNLYKAIQRSEYEYELHLRYDLYTKKHTQWYYFRVNNARPGIRYRFTIVNLMKPGSLYNQGMRPLMYSELDALNKKTGWKRCGEDIKYYRNNNRRMNMKGDKYYYSLTWTCTFPNLNDTYYFAHCYPYSYSDLQSYLLNLQNDPVRSRFCKQRVLCRTLAGNLVYVLTITSPSINPQHAKSKRAVVLTARVHPGETPASWMMKGFLDYLTGDSADAKLLRDTFVFKVIPMLNPDGVIVGNYRCSLAGRDLNRNYKSVLKESFPSVCHCKLLIKKLMEERDVTIYCDLHGHSRKQNVFIYGCENRHNPAKRLRERIFPFILNKNAPGKFCYESCKFKVQKSKEGTGRVVMWQMGIMNSFTMEATFCGSSMGNKANYHFSTKDYEDMGYHFCDSLLDYCDPDNSKAAQILCVLEERVRQEILAHLRLVGSPLPPDGVVDLNEEYMSVVESSTSGSDSSADDGLPVHLLAIAPKLQKKKKLKTRKERDRKRNPQATEKFDDGKRQSPQNEKEGSVSAGSGRRDEKVTSKIIRYQHVMPKDSHSTSRLHYNRHESSSVDREEKARKAEYLEALTNAYMKNGILPHGEKEIPTFRYTAGQRGMSSAPMNGVDGICPHHEKTFAAQYVANHLSDLQFADDQYEWGHSGKSTEDAQGGSKSRPLTRQHVVALSAVQQRQQDLLQLQHQMVRPQQSRPSTGHGSPIKTHPSPFDEQLEERRQSDYTDFVKRGYSAKTRSSHPNSRCPSATQISYPQPQPRCGSCSSGGGTCSSTGRRSMEGDNSATVTSYVVTKTNSSRQLTDQCHNTEQTNNRPTNRQLTSNRQRQKSADSDKSESCRYTGVAKDVEDDNVYCSRPQQHHEQQQQPPLQHRRQHEHPAVEEGLKKSTYQQTTGHTGSYSNHRSSSVTATKKSGRVSRAEMKDSLSTANRAAQLISFLSRRLRKQHLHVSPREERVTNHAQSGNKTNLSVSARQIVNDSHQHKQDEDARNLSTQTVDSNLTSHHSHANTRRKELSVSKLASGDNKYTTRYPSNPNEPAQSIYPPEKNVGSSHHFRRAETLTHQSDHGETWSGGKTRSRRSFSGGHVTSEGSPMDRDEMDYTEEEELRSASGYVPHRSQSRTPLVTTEPGRSNDPTISLTLERGYSYYDRFGSNRKHNRPPLLRYHPKRL